MRSKPAPSGPRRPASRSSPAGESPYFVDLGQLSRARQATELARLYAETIAAAELPAATLVGAAYKGIPLAALAAAALAATHERYQDVGFAYTRKEEKAHGEGGSTVGRMVAPAVVIDDILTAGTAARQAIAAARKAGAEVSALVVALDRQECATGAAAESALAAIGREERIRVLAIASSSDLVEVLEQDGKGAEAAALRRHLAEYGQPASPAS